MEAVVGAEARVDVTNVERGGDAEMSLLVVVAGDEDGRPPSIPPRRPSAMSPISGTMFPRAMREAVAYGAGVGDGTLVAGAVVGARGLVNVTEMNGAAGIDPGILLLVIETGEDDRVPGGKSSARPVGKGMSPGSDSKFSRTGRARVACGLAVGAGLLAGATGEGAAL